MNNELHPREPREMSGAWREAVQKLLAAGSTRDPVRKAGAWSIEIEPCGETAAGVVAILPGDYGKEAESSEEMIDGSGEGVDYEYERAVYACDAERAIFVRADHWQAGLFGEITIARQRSRVSRGACARGRGAGR